jgi:hypothetical protein
MVWAIVIIGVIVLLLRHHCISVSKGGRGGTVVWKYGSYIKSICNIVLIVVAVLLIATFW